MAPLVSIICISYNHALWIKEAVLSVFSQSYQPVELIIVDDASKDHSQQVIKALSLQYPQLKPIFNKENLGNCKSFNLGLQLAKGKYIIDLAADDILLPERIEKGVQSLETLGDEYGVNFCNAKYIDPNGKFLKHHYAINESGKAAQPIQWGNMYALLLQQYYICTPTMMMRKKILDELGGYDESLAYEDFDFWVRSSRKYLYAYTDNVLVAKRILKGSKSNNQYKKNCPQLSSTYHVCKKAALLNQTSQENLALLNRVYYEYRHAVFSGNYHTARLFFQLIKELKGQNLSITLLAVLAKMKLPLYIFRNLYLKTLAQ
jgi:glycosyltransferase involved in cell wall biosynthesis